MQNNQNKTTSSQGMVKVEILQQTPDGERVLRTITRPSTQADMFRKFPQVYRVVPISSEPKVAPQPSKHVAEANEKLKEVEETTSSEEPKKETAADLIKKIEVITDVNDLSPYMDSELKTVRTAAEKKFNELTKPTE